jgi:hypothetical protein
VYPSSEEFSEMLRTLPLGDVLIAQVLGGLPFVFRDDPGLETTLRRHLEDQLGPLDAMRIVGSGRIGFSLNPNNFPRRFSAESDIDVLIVSQELFDKVWMTMLRWNYPRRGALAAPDESWRRDRQRDLYWGWFQPDKIRFEGLTAPEELNGLRDLSAKWFNAFQSLGLHDEFADRRISGRLYRSWRHALLYHNEGLHQLKAIVTAEGG